MLALNKIIAHRGASAYAPENTMASFKKAMELGSNMIEFDVMCSEDGIPFVIHDDSLKRTTNGKGEVGQVDAAYLKSLDAGSWFSKRYAGEPIPEFKQLLQWLAKAPMQANIEIKPYPGTTEKTTTVVLSLIHQYWPHDKPLPLVSSFDFGALAFCHSIAPDMPLGLLMHTWDEQWLQKAKSLTCFSIHCNYKILNPTRVKAMKEQAYNVYAYTVNRQKLAKKLINMGVDAVFSDYPDLLS